MRRLIIDTDCGSDDAVAIIMALKCKEVCVSAITTVCGNVPLEQATLNTLMTLEICNKQQIPVYQGARKPMHRDLVTATNVHGQDGMGDSNLISPTISPQNEHAVDAIIQLVKSFPNEIEIVSIGPVTNIALAILKEPSVMEQVKHIYTMGTAGFGHGNTTPVAEFNVYVDAEAYNVMLNSKIPLTIVGFDICLGNAALNKADISKLLDSGSEVSEFVVKCNKSLLEYNIRNTNQHIIDLPDAIAMGVALWEDIIIESLECYCYTCIHEIPAYGQVIIDDGNLLEVSDGFNKHNSNATVCKSINSKLLKTRLFDLISK